MLIRVVTAEIDVTRISTGRPLMRIEAFCAAPPDRPGAARAPALAAPTRFRRSRRESRVTGFQRRVSRAFTPRTAPAIIRLTAASASPPSSGDGIVAKPIAEAVG